MNVDGTFSATAQQPTLRVQLLVQPGQLLVLNLKKKFKKLSENCKKNALYFLQLFTKISLVAEKNDRQTK